MDTLDPNIVNDSVLVFISTYQNNLFRITPYLHNEQLNNMCMYHQSYYTVFRQFAYRNHPCVIVKIEDDKYIISASLLLNMYSQFHDNTIYFDKYKVNSYPGSKLWKKCKLAVLHNYTVITRICNAHLIS